MAMTQAPKAIKSQRDCDGSLASRATMEITEPVVGVVLSGGRSSRMGGGDKCLLQLGGEPVLARIIDRLRPQVTRHHHQREWRPVRALPSFDLPVIADSIAGLAGPLAGVHAGLEWVKAHAPGRPHHRHHCERYAVFPGRFGADDFFRERSIIPLL